MNTDRDRKQTGKKPSGPDELFRVVERAKREWERTFDVIPDLITIIGPDCRIVRANRAVAEAFGLPITEVPGRFCYRLFHGIDRPPGFCPHRRLLEDGKEHTAEGRLAGVEGDFLITVSPFFDGEGKLTGAVQIARDITAQKRAENRYRDLYDGVPIGLFRSTPEGKFLDVNPSLVSLLGFPDREALLAFNARGLYLDPADRDRWREQADREGIARDFEISLRRPDGKIIRVRNTVRAVRDPAGKVLYYEGSLEDITEKTALAAQVGKLQRMDSLGRLAGGIAHEFGNILTSVGCDIQLLKYRLEKDHQDCGDLDEIIKSVKRATDLTRRLYEFSRPAAENPQELDCNRLLLEMEKMLRGVLRKNINLTVTTAPRPAMVRADRGDLEGSVMNLVINARDAMGEGGDLAISLRIERGEDSGSRPLPGPAGEEYAVIEVRDTGEGMEEEVLARIFEPSFTTKKEDGCLGLGLPVVYAFIRRAGGAVAVESNPGEGTAFRIYLPLLN